MDYDLQATLKVELEKAKALEDFQRCAEIKGLIEALVEECGGKGGQDAPWTAVKTKREKFAQHETESRCRDGYGCRLQLECKLVHTRDERSFFDSAQGKLGTLTLHR